MGEYAAFCKLIIFCYVLGALLVAPSQLTLILFIITLILIFIIWWT